MHSKVSKKELVKGFMKSTSHQTQIEIVQPVNQLIKLLKKEYLEEKHGVIWELETFKKPILQTLGEHFVQKITRL